MHKTEKVEFVRQKTTKFGEGLYVVGSIPALGEWDPSRAIKLKWTEGNNWRGEIYVEDPSTFEYKYFVSGYEGIKPNHIIWDEGPNSKLTINSNLRQPNPKKEIKVLSFNIRYDNCTDGPNVWIYRREMVTKIIKNSGADFVGIQEALYSQLCDLQSELPMYKWYGRGRDIGSENGEFSAILYLHEFWDFEEGNTIWLSDTPTVEGSRSFGNDLPRICTWGRFVNKTHGMKVIMANCHLDHISENAQRKGSMLIKNTLSHVGKSDKYVVLTGDFNAMDTSDTVNIMLNDYRKLNDSQKKGKGPFGTFHGWMGNADGNRIDYILTSESFECLKYDIIRDSINNRFPSDHFPILAELIPK